jgi:tripartite-type tricarboxylate transporter receptor subunit TctC
MAGGWRILGCFIALATAAPLAAYAQYPASEKRITLVVPFSIGGSNDILARVIGQKLSDSWHIPVIVMNQIGASGALGAAKVAKAEPDGYTLLMLSSTYTINGAVTTALPFDPRTSFTAVAMLGKAPMMLAVARNLPAQDAKALITLATQKSGTLNYGSAGVGSVNHMAMELLKNLAGLDIKHVPYRAGNEAVNDMLGGHLDMFIGSLPQMMELARGGFATPVAVTSAQRSSVVPDIPTLAESGVSGYELEQWWGIVVPKGTPDVVVATLNRELNHILASAEVEAFMAREGAQITPSTPEQFAQYLTAEFNRWEELVKTLQTAAH